VHDILLIEPHKHIFVEVLRLVGDMDAMLNVRSVVYTHAVKNFDLAFACMCAKICFEAHTTGVGDVIGKQAIGENDLISNNL
jgi:hypothetical protein